LAQELWAASLKQGTGKTALADLAWAHSKNELVRPDTDRARTARRMKALLAAEPRLDTKANRALLKSLEAALVPTTAKPGTVERLMDDRTEMCNRGRPYGEADRHYTRLAHAGFVAVPALIEHLDDDRLTRSVKQGFNVPTWNMRVKDVVSDLLQELAG